MVIATVGIKRSLLPLGLEGFSFCWDYKVIATVGIIMVLATVGIIRFYLPLGL